MNKYQKGQEIFDFGFSPFSSEGIKRKSFFSRIVKDYMDDDKNLILDIACGTGLSTSALEENGFDVFGIDTNFEYLRSAKSYDKKMKKNNEYIQMDAMICSFKNRVFDGVTLLGDPISLFDLYNTKRIFANVYNVLKPDGLIFLNYNDWLRRVLYEHTNKEIIYLDSSHAYCLDNATINTQNGKLMLAYTSMNSPELYTFELHLISPFIIEFILAVVGFKNICSYLIKVDDETLPNIITKAYKKI